MSDVSPWWPTPARPDDHFSVRELARSGDLHGPLRRIRLGLAGAKLAALAALAWLLGTDEITGRLDDASSGVRALVGASAIVLAIRGPEALAGWSMRRLPSVDVAASGPDLGWPARVLARSAGVFVFLAAVALAGSLLLGLLTGQRSGWFVALALAGVMTALNVVATDRRGRISVEAEVPTAWASLVWRAGLGGRVDFGLLAESSDRPSQPNACAIGGVGRRWILVDRSLQPPAAAVPAELGDFIVAHEVTHLAGRHPRIQLLLHGALILAALSAVPAMAALGWPWTSIGLAPDDPLSLPVAGLVVAVGAGLAWLPVAWVLRALERLADAGAVDLAGVPDRSMARALHLAAGADLDPPAWVMLFASRPSPAQRLEYLDRRRRSLTPPRPSPTGWSHRRVGGR